LAGEEESGLDLEGFEEDEKEWVGGIGRLLTSCSRKRTLI
jgi:hypothetical protein